MSAPLVVNTADGTCWTLRATTRDGGALYAPEGVCECPRFVMATLPELAEHGIVGSADALPAPVGPLMPPFPPAPESFEEKLRQDVARLQGLFAEAVADRHRAERERDEIRERVAEPYGCAHCGDAERHHGKQYLSGMGLHGWVRPSDVQVKERMLARRAVCADVRGLRAYGARMQRVNAGLRARVAALEAQRQADHATWQHDLRTARGERDALTARIGELEAERHSTNEALDDAVQALRAGETERSADKLTRLLAPTPTLHEDEPSEACAPRTERSYWVDIADALNAAESVGLSVGIDLDGTLTDRTGWSVIWDRAATQWVVAGYEDEAADAGETGGAR
ncbi:hypothetical protein DCW30_05595 [Streptomyces alfalfae]|uniref:Uncharacterized protein n=1 Tax=Streptomyces alfalfae TaxID=1642299 RepID=A0ABM6GVU0_9ACTN|nr:hypothetical protein [Streptomyces alfalfae]APY88225.1 hypothetical protein A7J05_23280 [Streptomyces alfalfae]AYA18620.1 hypothetical protein D3X13_22390 [Streptomyces fradiae]RXX46500.1 hypothetical protein DCW30_05595 [Streptomyces alfalfae]RZM90013.1 hypothetical protein D4104_25530 [Streptomyces alfalfae]